MHHEAEVGLVEAHPEGGGRHQCLHPVGLEVVLGLLAVRVLRLARVRGDRVPAVPQVGGDLLGRRHGQRVDDPGARQLPEVVGEPGQPVRRVGQGQHRQAQALPVEGAAQDQRVGAGPGAQLFGDVGRHAGVGRGGRGQDRDARREVGEHGAQPAVVGPEVVAPVGDAVGLVHDEQAGRGGELRQHLVPEIGVVEPLRAHQQDIHLARRDLGLDPLPFLGIGGVDGARADPGPGRGLDLVAHEREQRGDDHGGAGAARAQQRGRDEVHRGLAPARALHDQGPPLVRDEGLDRPPLVLAQPGGSRGVAHETGEYGVGRGPQVCVHAPMQPDGSDIAPMPLGACGC